MMDDIQVSPLKAGMSCRCPRCGEGKLYSGFLTVGKECDACGLDYSRVDSGDGPAVFVIMIVGAIVVTLALIVELNFEPPFWVHVVLWVPAIFGGCLGLLRPLKSTLIAYQFRYAATQDVEIE